jgi:hypothetical protein
VASGCQAETHTVPWMLADHEPVTDAMNAVLLIASESLKKSDHTQQRNHSACVSSLRKVTFISITSQIEISISNTLV